jgi:DNA end-binding protein Ku
MARPTWKGSISFGLVDIPVALYSAEERNDLSFHQLDKRDLKPVGYKRVNKETGEEVAWGDIVKGYEYAPDEYVILGEADFKKANPEASKIIEIQDFVDASSVDPLYFETPYYIEPIRKDSKGYTLLREALEKTKKIGIAQFVLRTRQYLAAVMPKGKLLVLMLLRYAQELRAADNLEIPAEHPRKHAPSEREIEMATKLVEGMSAEWDPDRYRDTYADDLHDVIEKKIKAGKTHVIEEPEDEEEPAPKAEVYDLTKLLERSLKEGHTSKKKPAAAHRARTHARAHARGHARGHAKSHRRKKAA